MGRLNGTTLPTGPDWPPVTPQLPPSYFVTSSAVYTIEAEGVKVSAPYELDALRMFGRVRRAMRRRKRRAEKQEVASVEA